MNKCIQFFLGVIVFLFAFDASGQSGLFGSGSDAEGIFSGTRISGFVVGSFSYNSAIQMVPEFAGGAPALTDAGQAGFRFDRIGLGLSKTFSSWLSASGAFEVENHRDRHAHGFDPGFGCPGDGPCVERFGAEEAETEVELDKFALNITAPVGNGLILSVGRFDLPFGMERHDEPFLLSATTSEVFRYGRPNTMTGLQANYTVSPVVDISFWLVNRWENETTHDEFQDNNESKSMGGRIGFTPIQQPSLLNMGVGFFTGEETEESDTAEQGRRTVLDVDFAWSASETFLVTGEFVWGSESHVSMRERGIPYPTPAVENADVDWFGVTLLAHQDFHPWMGFTVRYGYFADNDGWRTGVPQNLQSITLVPVFHLSRAIAGARPTGISNAHTRHPIDWIDLRLEYRFQHSDKNVFSDAEPATDILDAKDSSHQFQAQVVLNF